MVLRGLCEPCGWGSDFAGCELEPVGMSISSISGSFQNNDMHGPFVVKLKYLALVNCSRVHKLET